MSDTHVEFQYETLEHQSDASLDGMWLFLAQEVLFFGGLFLAWVTARHFHPLGFHRGAQETDLAIGSINAFILITSSFAYAAGLQLIRAGSRRGLILACGATIALGVAFLALKGLEWSEDIDKHMLPGPHFGITGPDAGGAQLFWVFYWVATVLHGLHLTVGLVLVGWVILKARKGAYSAGFHNPVEVIGLYWSFVDIVWLVLYPMIYLAGRPG
jgi:cytochrome c oxidase subunit III